MSDKERCARKETPEQAENYLRGQRIMRRTTKRKGEDAGKRKRRTCSVRLPCRGNGNIILLQGERYGGGQKGAYVPRRIGEGREGKGVTPRFFSTIDHHARNLETRRAQTPGGVARPKRRLTGEKSRRGGGQFFFKSRVERPLTYANTTRA